MLSTRLTCVLCVRSVQKRARSGFAVGSAVLTALSLLAAFKEEATHSKKLSFDVSDPMLLAGTLLGAMLPFFFAALTMMSVGKAAAEMIEEVPAGPCVVGQFP